MFEVFKDKIGNNDAIISKYKWSTYEKRIPNLSYPAECIKNGRSYKIGVK